MKKNCDFAFEISPLGWGSWGTPSFNDEITISTYTRLINPKKELQNI